MANFSNRADVIGSVVDYVTESGYSKPAVILATPTHSVFSVGGEAIKETVSASASYRIPAFPVEVPDGNVLVLVLSYNDSTYFRMVPAFEEGDTIPQDMLYGGKPRNVILPVTEDSFKLVEDAVDTAE